MRYIADLHVHSKYSRATARNLDLEHLYTAAREKGIHLVGTGDFTHPAWFAELKDKLVPAEPGFFALRPDLARALDRTVPPACRGTVRFILAAEISNIYKKGERTRKNHNLVFLPDLDAAARLNRKLDGIGNLNADGRPILGLDARHLLEIVLEISPDGFLIPAHIWTPWFSLLGSKSGFDSIEECFDDLSGHIFAVETGLSSDPPMNRRVSFLDPVTLVSNSDAHSPAKLGREANRFDTGFSYPALKQALESGDPARFPGTIEFFPEEGKYHADGHRKCQVRLLPEETDALDGLCPVCGKPLTLGVLYRVAVLADRKEGAPLPSGPTHDYLVPLTDILAELLRVGPATKKVKAAYADLLKSCGPELDILLYRDPGSLDRAGIPLLGEAIRRLRQNRVVRLPGYDGEYGRISLFSPEEREALLGQGRLFAMGPEAKPPQNPSGAGRPPKAPRTPPAPASQDRAVTLNDQQAAAVAHGPGGAMIIIAGPGTGKTRTLTCRIAHLMGSGQAKPEHVLAVTFTNQAAEEMKTRLVSQGMDPARLPLVSTFHALCLLLLTAWSRENRLEPKPASGGGTVIDEAQQRFLMADAMALAAEKGGPAAAKPRELLAMIALAKQHHLGPEDDCRALFAPEKLPGFGEVYAAYQHLLSMQHLVDFEDLLFRTVRILETRPAIREDCQRRFRFIFVDEYQDLNESQYRIIKALAAPGNHLCVIGDPDQSIYGFRGSDARFFNRFAKDHADAAVIHLNRNYRSTETILKAAYQVVRSGAAPGEPDRVYSGIQGTSVIRILERETETQEAEAIAGIIENLVGGTGHHSLDTGRIQDIYTPGARAFSDFAILTRTHAQHRVLVRVLERCGIPCTALNKTRLFQKRGICDVLSRLRLWQGEGTFLDLERVARLIRGGPGKKTLEAFKAWSYQHRFTLKAAAVEVHRFPVPSLPPRRQLDLVNFLERVSHPPLHLADATVADRVRWLIREHPLLAAPDLDPGIRAIGDLMVERAEPFGRDGAAFLSALALQADVDLYDPRAEKVAIMTLHAAKGLEFPVVFIAGCEAGLIPFQKAGEPADREEEKRLLFVAMTRAREMLCLTHARKRMLFGVPEARTLSPLVGAIEKHLIKQEKTAKEQAKKTAHVQLRLF